MKINVLKIFFVLLYCLYGVNSLHAQSLTELEKKYERLNFQYDKEIKTLDSLKNIYLYRTSLIDSEKEKKNTDNEKIVDLMAGAVAISNRIEEQNKKIIRIENDIENVKQVLHEVYIAKIDSLQSLKKKQKDDEKILDAEILRLTEKNILVAPKILSLSFNPEKILEIDLNKTKDPKEKILYKEYLDNAFREVDDLLESVTVQYSEVNQIVSLQTKTRKFLEETELESNMIIQSQRNQSNEVNATGFQRETSNTGISNTSADFVSNVRTYQLILRQLDIQQLSKADLKISFEEMNRNLDVKEYQKLLKEVKERLQEFKLVLANKIGSFK